MSICIPLKATLYVMRMILRRSEMRKKLKLIMISFIIVAIMIEIFGINIKVFADDFSRIGTISTQGVNREYIK